MEEHMMSDETLTTAAADAPKQFKVDREDQLQLMVLTERSRRIESEKAKLNSDQALLQAENREFVRYFRDKYRADLASYVVDLETGVASPRQQQ